jgi:hypothetical protein
MTDPKKAKGDKFERDLRDHFLARGWDADRTRAGYARDHGDIHLAVTPTGPRVIVQAKNHRRITLPEWLRQMAEQKHDAGAEHAVLVVKRSGIGDPGKSYAVMELDDLLALLRQAGYGSPTVEEAAS